MSRRDIGEIIFFGSCGGVGDLCRHHHLSAVGMWNRRGMVAMLSLLCHDEMVIEPSENV